MKLRIKDRRIIVTTSDTRAAMLIINDFLVKELRLFVLPINSFKVQALNNIIIMIRVINEPLLKYNKL